MVTAPGSLLALALASTAPEHGRTAASLSLEAHGGGVFGITSGPLLNGGLTAAVGLRHGSVFGALTLGAEAAPLLLQVGATAGLRFLPWVCSVRVDFGPFGYSGAVRVGALLAPAPAAGLMIGLEARVVRYTLLDGTAFGASAILSQTWDFPLGG